MRTTRRYCRFVIGGAVPARLSYNAAKKLLGVRPAVVYSSYLILPVRQVAAERQWLPPKRWRPDWGICVSRGDDHDHVFAPPTPQGRKYFACAAHPAHVPHRDSGSSQVTKHHAPPSERGGRLRTASALLRSQSGPDKRPGELPGAWRGLFALPHAERGRVGAGFEGWASQ